MVTCVKRIPNGFLTSNHTPNFNTMHPAVPEIGKVMPTWCALPIMTYGKRMTNGSLATHQIAAQWVLLPDK